MIALVDLNEDLFYLEKLHDKMKIALLIKIY